MYSTDTLAARLIEIHTLIPFKPASFLIHNCLRLLFLLLLVRVFVHRRPSRTISAGPSAFLVLPPLQLRLLQQRQHTTDRHVHARIPHGDAHGRLRSRGGRVHDRRVVRDARLSGDVDVGDGRPAGVSTGRERAGGDDRDGRMCGVTRIGRAGGLLLLLSCPERGG